MAEISGGSSSQGGQRKRLHQLSPPAWEKVTAEEEEEGTPHGVGPARGRKLWGLLQRGFRRAVEKMKKEEMKTTYLSHGLQHWCRLVLASPVRHVTHDSQRKAFVVLDSANTLHLLTEDGCCRGSVKGPAPMAGVLYVSQVDQFVAWDAGGLQVLDPHFRLLSQVQSLLPIHCSIYSEQLNRIVTAGDGNLTLWDFRYGFRSLQCHASVRTGLGPHDVFVRLALDSSSSEPQRCFASCDAGVATFDIARGGNLLAFKTTLHSREITDLAYCEAIGCVITASRDTTIKVWDKEWHIQIVFVGHTAPVVAVTIYPQRPLIFSASQDGTVRTWNLNTIDQVDQVHVLEPVEALETHTRAHVISISGCTLNLWKINQLYSLYAWLGSPAKRLSCTDLSTIGNFPVRVLCLCQDSTVRLLEAQSGAPLSVLSLDQPSRAQEVAYCLPRETLFVLLEQGHVLRVNTATSPMTVKKSFSSSLWGSRPCCLLLYSHLVDPDKAYTTWLEVTQSQGYRKTWQKGALQGQDRNRFLPILGHKDGSLSILDWFSGRVQYTVEAHSFEPVTALAEYPSQTCVLSAGADLTVKMWRLFPYAEECLLLLLCFSCACPAWHMCSLGETLAVAFQDPGTVTYSIVHYNLMEQTRSEHGPEDDAQDDITGLCCCPNLKLFASASRDGSVKVWDMRNRLLRHLKLNTIPESLAFANHKGDLLVGLEQHLYLISHSEYLPSYYQMKLLWAKFLEPLQNVSLPISTSNFEALVRENRRRLMQELPSKEAEAEQGGLAQAKWLAGGGGQGGQYILPRIGKKPGGDSLRRRTQRQGRNRDTTTELAWNREPSGMGMEHILGAEVARRLLAWALQLGGGSGFPPLWLLQGRSLQWLRERLPPCNSGKGGRRHAAGHEEKRRFCSRSCRSPMSGSCRMTLKESREVREARAKLEGISQLVARNWDLQLLQEGKITPAKKLRFTRKMREEAFERYLQVFYRKQLSLKIPEEDPFDADEVLEALDQVDPIAALRGPTISSMFLGGFAKPRPPETDSSIFADVSPSLLYPSSAGIPAVLQVKRKKVDIVTTPSSARMPEPPALERAGLPPPHLAQEAPEPLGPLPARAGRRVSLPALRRSVEDAVTSAARSGRAEKSEVSAQLLGAPQAPLPPSPWRDSFSSKKSVVLGGPVSPHTGQEPQKYLASASLLKSPQLSIITKGFFPERPTSHQGLMSPAELESQSFQVPRISSGFIPNSVVAQQLYPLDMLREKLMTVIGPQEGVWMNGQWVEHHEWEHLLQHHSECVESKGLDGNMREPFPRQRAETLFKPEKQDKIWKRLGQTLPDSLGYKRGRSPWEQGWLGLGGQEGVLWLWAPRLFPGEAVKGPVPSFICQASERSSRASLIWTFAGEEPPEEEPLLVATDSTSKSGITPMRKEEVPSPKQRSSGIFLTQLDESQYPEPAREVPEFVLPFVGQAWFQKLFPEVRGACWRPRTLGSLSPPPHLLPSSPYRNLSWERASLEGFPPKMSLEDFLKTLQESLLSHDVNIKRKVVGIIALLQDQLDSEARSSIQNTLIQVLNEKGNVPSLPERIQQNFSLEALRLLLMLDRESQDAIVQLMVCYLIAPAPRRAVIKDMITGLGLQDPDSYFFKEMDSWPVGTEDPKEVVQQFCSQWLEKAIRIFQEHRIQLWVQGASSGKKPSLQSCHKEQKSRKPLQKSRKEARKPSGGAMKPAKPAPKKRAALPLRREVMDREEDLEEQLGRKDSSEDPQKAKDQASPWQQPVRPVDAIQYFTERQLESKPEEMKELVPFVVDSPQDTVLALPPLQKAQAILRLGETNAMLRTRVPERFYFPYIFPRYLMSGFVPFVKLPLPKINLEPFPSLSRRPASPKTFTATQRLVQKYFIPKFSYADSYP
ncbi:WD repeat-containing protein 97 [Candoia aspera]|uniref:WD repeat-containing protein 97 n=1 Tax=Candoia aspera TaxID=51853 RepID=UPI002FD7BAB3